MVRISPVHVRLPHVLIHEKYEKYREDIGLFGI